MPLPQQVINQISREPAKTPGWSSGVILFSIGIFVVVVAIYIALVFVYTPYLNSQLTTAQNKISQLAQAVSPTDATNLVTLYSQVSNVQSLLTNHVLFSQFLTWLGANTEANVSYNQFSFALGTGNLVTLSGVAPSEADVNEQVAIFEASPAVQSVSVSNVGQPAGGAGAQFSATLVMNPSVFTAPTSTAAAAPAVNNTTTTTP